MRKDCKEFWNQPYSADLCHYLPQVSQTQNNFSKEDIRRTPLFQQFLFHSVSLFFPSIRFRPIPQKTSQSLIQYTPHHLSQKPIVFTILNQVGQFTKPNRLHLESILDNSLAMKRGYQQESSSSASFGPPQSKFRHNPEGDQQFLEDESTKLFARKVADHYSARTNQTLEEREASPIIHLKKLNNWIKSVLIQLYARRGDAVLDLACGKGGDLIKWDKAKIGYYVGIDIAEGSIEDCRTRYNGDADHHQRRKKFTFPARLLCGDCFEARLDKVLADDSPFDICSCQFAMHYSWSTEARARRALANVSALLRPGGIFIGTMPDANVIIKKLREAEGLTFGNSVYWIRFDEEFSEKKFKSSSPFGIKYKFHLEDAVDCPEWIVPFHVFKLLAEEYDLELVFVKNNHVFVEEYMKKPDFVELMRRLGALGDGNQDQSTLSPDEWEVAYLYLAYVLRKRGQPDQTRVAGRRDKGKMHVKEEDVTHIGSGA